MYKIPNNFDPQILENKTISQICYTSNQISLLWDEGSLHIMGSFSILNRDFQQSYHELYPIKSDHKLLALLDQRIISADISKERDKLSIHFENGSLLTLCSDPNYESFEMNFSGERIIV